MFEMFQMMAFRVRVLHSVILTLVGLSFVFYTSYYANPVQVYHIESKHEGMLYS